jgi:ketosteroid isomerase-like protein
MSEVERVYRAYNDAENAHDLEATTALVTEDLAVAINGIPQLSSGSDDEQAMAALFATYPDYRREVLEVIVEGDRGAIRWRMVGTPAAGRDIAPLDLHGCSVVEVRDGRLARANLYADMSVLAAVLPGGEQR